MQWTVLRTAFCDSAYFQETQQVAHVQKWERQPQKIVKCKILYIFQNNVLVFSGLLFSFSKNMFAGTHMLSFGSSNEFHTGMTVAKYEGYSESKDTSPVKVQRIFFF
jgi:hypothetical protein